MKERTGFLIVGIIILIGIVSYGIWLSQTNPDLGIPFTIIFSLAIGTFTYKVYNDDDDEWD